MATPILETKGIELHTFFNVETIDPVRKVVLSLEGEELPYDLLITQRLILQPEAEINFYSKADPGRKIGTGLSDIDAGVRLRYEISRKFAPYAGVAYVGRFGQTAHFAQRDGEGAAAVQFLFGIRSWF